jgi:hypothetical protein
LDRNTATVRHRLPHPLLNPIERVAKCLRLALRRQLSGIFLQCWLGFNSPNLNAAIRHSTGKQHIEVSQFLDVGFVQPALGVFEPFSAYPG